jgi:serine/threonine protein kinase
MRECAILEQLDHPNVVKQIEVEWRLHKAKIYMEYCEGGSLQDLINEQKVNKTHVAEKYVWDILFQLASALVYCHMGLRIESDGQVSTEQQNILDWKPVLHRDIKPDNVFLLNRSELAIDNVKLGDFGLGYILQNNAAPYTYAGTAQYLAPEVNRMRARPIHWTDHCDIFSLGCTIYALCTLKPPFENHIEAECDYPPLPEHYSVTLNACIASCLSFHAETRPSALRLFQHCQQHVKDVSSVTNKSLKPDADINETSQTVNASSNNTPRSTSKKKRRDKTEEKGKERKRFLPDEGWIASSQEESAFISSAERRFGSFDNGPSWTSSEEVRPIIGYRSDEGASEFEKSLPDSKAFIGANQKSNASLKHSLTQLEHYNSREEELILRNQMRYDERRITRERQNRMAREQENRMETAQQERMARTARE